MWPCGASWQMRWRISAALVDLPVPVGAEQREMLAEHGIDIERAAHVLGRVDGADLDMGALISGEDTAQVLARHRMDRRPGHRIAGDAAAERAQRAGDGIGLALAQEIDLRHDVVALAVEEAHRTDIGDQPAHAGAELHLAADLAGRGQRQVRLVGEQRQGRTVEPHQRGGARNLDQGADREMRRCGAEALRRRRRLCAHEPVAS